LECGEPLGEPRLLRAPQLWSQLARDGIGVVVDVGHVENCLLGLDRQLPRRRRGFRCELVGELEEVVARHRLVGQSDALGFLAVEHLAEEHCGHRGLRAGDPAEHPGVTATGVDAELQESRVELGPIAHDPDVTTKREVHPRADRCPVDGRERREWRTSNTKEPFIDHAEALTGGLGEVAEVGSGTECRWRSGDDHGPDVVVGFETIHRSENLFDHRVRHRVAFVRIVERQRGDAVGDVGEYEGHRPIMPPRRAFASNRESLRLCRSASSLGAMLDHVFTDAISALRDAFESAFLERQAFEEHFQSDVLSGDLTWETSYGLPGEGEPPRVVAHITFDWPAWSQAVYRQWSLEERLERRPAIEIEIVLRVQQLVQPPTPELIYATVPDTSPLVGDGRLERAGLTAEVAHPDPADDPPNVGEPSSEHAVEITYEGLYELAEATVADGTNSLLDEHFGVLGGWIASTLVKLGDLGLEFLPDTD